jgi:hypothetical protein
MEEFIEKIKHQISANPNGWVICGNYNVAKQITLPAATHIIWLNYPLYKNLWRGLKRSVKRILSNQNAFNGCRETFSLTFLSKKSILVWILQTHKGRRIEFTRLLTKRNFPQANIFIVKNERQYKKILSLT